MATSFRYFFILGNTPILSSAEIFAVLGRQGIPAQWVSVAEEVAQVETATSIDPAALMKTLGGTIKIGALLRSDMTTEQWVRSKCCKGAPCSDKGHPCRIVVGVSVYKAAVGVANAKCDETLRTVRGEVLTCKRIMKEEGRSPITNPPAGRVVTGRALRLVTGRERALPSVALVTEHILERGGELVAFVSHQGIQFGETIAVQAFHEYRHRDMGRPSRDARRGMLPPKVAQMMVNIAGAPDGGIILDPFCGSGTVLSEAALLGYRTVGSDIAEEAVDDAKKNLEWLTSSRQLSPPKADPPQAEVVPCLPAGRSCQLFVSDVRYLSDHVQKHSIDAIVTEPYLGPPLTGRETPLVLGKVRRDVHALVTDAFESFRNVLRPGGRVVIVLPVLGGELLPIDAIEKLGWRIVPPFSPVIVMMLREAMQTNQSLTPRNTILYGRADQHLAREITVWTHDG